MSTQQRTAHLTGFNNDLPGQQPERGSFYAPVGGGAPGILGGPASGFTIAFTLFNKSLDGSDIWGDADSAGGSEEQFIVGATGPLGIALDGWTAAVGDGGRGIGLNFGEAQIEIPPDSMFMQDVIIVASYIPDSALYGGPGGTQLVSSFNGEMADLEAAAAFAYAGGDKFALLGTDFDFEEPEIVGGCRYAQFGSFWITEGIPNQRQLQDFVQASMMAGEIVPAAWQVARTAAVLDPAVPDAPTGHHWSANDVDIDRGLGGTWTDRIGGIVLERVGTISGVERELARDPQYHFPNPEG